MADDILLVGASGFIGKVLLRGLSDEYNLLGVYNSDKSFKDFAEKIKARNDIDTLQCNLANRSETSKNSKLFNEFPICVFLAGNTFTGLSVEQPSIDIEKNILTLTTLLENYNCKRILYFSSGAVYEGNMGPVTPKSPVNPTLPYSVSKFAAEGYVKNFALRKKTLEEYLNIRFFGSYGEYEPERKLYRKLVKTALDRNSNSFTIHGDGTNYIDAMLTDDTVSATKALIRTDKTNITLDLNQGEPKTIKDLCKTVFHTLNRIDIEIKVLEDSIPESNSFYSIDTQMSETIGWQKQYSLVDGIKRYADKYL